MVGYCVLMERRIKIEWFRVGEVTDHLNKIFQLMLSQMNLFCIELELSIKIGRVLVLSKMLQIASVRP